MLYWFTVPIIAISFVVLAITVGRHWKEIRLLNPDSIKEELVRKKRDELITRRFERVKASALFPVKALFHQAVILCKKTFHGAYIKLVQLDRFYKQPKASLPGVITTNADRVKMLMDGARSLTRDSKWADAERRYLEVLSIDKRNVNAYRGLAVIYLKQKLYPQAKETFEFLVNTKKADDSCYAGLAEIADHEGDTASAEQWYRKAVEYHPRLAHRHAELAMFYLDRQEPAKAWPFISRAAELEPKSPKYLVLSIETAIRTGNREEARRRYDAMRLISEDRQKLQTLKERIDEMDKLKR
jgi:Tfp pilus assembly protein PilF